MSPELSKTKSEKMKGGNVSAEREVKVPASEAWKVYGSLEFDRIIEEALPHVFDKIDVVEGDGGVGTIIQVFFQPGMGGPLKSYKEKFMVVDDEKRVKQAEAVEGGYLDLGFTLYRTRLEVIEKAGIENECTTRVTIEYELKEEAAANASLVSIEAFASCLQVIADYLYENNSSSSNNNNSD